MLTHLTKKQKKIRMRFINDSSNVLVPSSHGSEDGLSSDENSDSSPNDDDQESSSSSDEEKYSFESDSLQFENYQEQ